MPKVVIAAGGTAGHVLPALAVADALRDSGAEVEFAGGERAEAELVPAAGYRLHPLPVAGIDRRNPLRAGRAAGLAGAATVRARALLRRVGADAVMGGGGYVAGPVGLAARSLRLPLVLTEADSHLGLANRMLAPFAARVFLAFPLEGRAEPRFRVVGRPLGSATRPSPREAARERLGLPHEVVCVLVFGGSLGARRINDAAVEAFGGAFPCLVLHVSGRRDHAELERRLAALGSPPNYRLVAYVEPFADALGAADIAVARAGGSVLELAAAGLPSVLVPYPHATADHQTLNARHMERAGAAVVVPDAQLDGPRLAREVAALLGAPDRLRRMSEAASAVSRPDAAEVIARELLALVRGSAPGGASPA